LGRLRRLASPLAALEGDEASAHARELKVSKRSCRHGTGRS
jgi:hypothetical protein